MYQRESGGVFKHIDFILWDLASLLLAFVLAYELFHKSMSADPFAQANYRSMILTMELVAAIVLLANNSLSDVLKRGFYLEFAATLHQVVYTLGLSAVLMYLTRNIHSISRLILGFTFVFYLCISYVIRCLWKRLLKKRMADQEGERSLLIITTKARAGGVIESIKEQNFGRYRLAGAVVLDDDMTGRKIGGVEVISKAEDAPAYVCQNWIDEVLVVPQENNKNYPKNLIEKLMQTGVTVHVNLAKVVNIPGKKQMVEQMADYTVLTTSMNYASPAELLIKRFIDILGGIAGCIITGIVYIFVAPQIKKSSPGPVFLAQERIGKNGKKFKMYKFRSMYLDAEARKEALMAQNQISDARMFKMDFDPRVIGNEILPDGTRKTGIGQFLRNSSLDEFPQFFNVLKGDMSIVGTRPPLDKEVSLYELHHRARLAIKPGITGMWQVSGRSDITDFEEVVRLDREYINNWNLGLDIKILVKTVQVVLKKEGSR